MYLVIDGLRPGLARRRFACLRLVKLAGSWGPSVPPCLGLWRPERQVPVSIAFCIGEKQGEAPLVATLVILMPGTVRGAGKFIRMSISSGVRKAMIYLLQLQAVSSARQL